MFSVAGITFHWYGFIVGLAAATGTLLCEKKARQVGIAEKTFWNLFGWISVPAIIGARVYHVWTDFSHYQYSLWDTVKIWQGGLSIIGAVIGGMFGVWLFIQIHHPKQISFSKILDLAVFGLPFGQAVGRLGNYVNQELYGLPTSLPWGIFIAPQNRLLGFERFEKFHPLFAYEMIATISFGVFIWWWESRRKSNSMIGSGQYFWWYILYYSCVRFVLDFLRIDKTLFVGTQLGFNQVVLLGVIIIIIAMKIFKKKFRPTQLLLILFLVPFILTACQNKLAQPLTTPLDTVTHFQDHQKVPVSIHGKPLQIEVVMTPASLARGLSGRDRIGADGMLFVLNQKGIPTFWMKDMKFNLDFVWLDDLKVVEVTENVQAPIAESVSDSKLPIYSPHSPANMVLEMNAGDAKKYEIVNGDQIEVKE